jgi:hypothetical protein
VLTRYRQQFGKEGYPACWELFFTGYGISVHIRKGKKHGVVFLLFFSRNR